MAEKLGAGKQGKLMAISKAPSINYTNSKRTSTAGFTLIQTLNNAVNTAQKTTFNGQPAYLLDQTTQPTCRGDAPGWAGGVKSGTVGKEVKPISGASSILVEGKQLVREGDTCTMNNSNTTGTYVTMDGAVIDDFESMSDEELNAYLNSLPLYAGPAVGAYAGKARGTKKNQHIIDMIDLSRDSYSNVKTWDAPPGYDRLSRAQIDELGLDPNLFYNKKDTSGFYASMYKDNNGNYAIAFRGTEKSLNDVGADILQGTGFVSEQYDKANKLALALKKNSNFTRYNTTFTGHSLGGGLASVTGSVTGYPTYTFNAAGVHKKTMQRYNINTKSAGHVQAYYTQNDPLNALQDNRQKVFTALTPAFPTLVTAARATDALPPALGQRIKVITNDSFRTGHNTDGMRKALDK